MNEQLKVLVMPVTVGVVAFCGGLSLGYMFGARRKVTVYVDRKEPIRPQKVVIEPKTEMEIDKPAFVEKRQIVLTPNPDPADIKVDHEAKKLRERLTADHGYSEANKIIEDMKRAWVDEYAESDEERVVNVFAGTSEKWNYDEELRNRTKTAPYVLHKDEFWAEESGYEQSTLTYFQGDDILVDDKDVPIYNHNIVIGELKFGHGSGDLNVFYVRNVGHQAEYEILMDRGSYAIEILGLDADQFQEKEESIRHSSTKFRPDD